MYFHINYSSLNQVKETLFFLCWRKSCKFNKKNAQNHCQHTRKRRDFILNASRFPLAISAQQMSGIKRDFALTERQTQSRWRCHHTAVERWISFFFCCESLGRRAIAFGSCKLLGILDFSFDFWKDLPGMRFQDKKIFGHVRQLERKDFGSKLICCDCQSLYKHFLLLLLIYYKIILMQFSSSRFNSLVHSIVPPKARTKPPPPPNLMGFHFSNFMSK